MGKVFKITGTAEIGKALAKAISLEDVKAIVVQNGAELQRGMQRQTEVAFRHPTGQTKRSIELTMKDGGLTAEVAPGTEYSAYLEYGTRFMEAEPFVGPALNQQMPQFKSDLKKLIEK